ncbi:type II toxin-antitoxin system Phd/YefM family antitoxin [Streptomyces sp. NPDC052095]|uniref:type II toxin-antitoxin system Phd/YefM family antitoxin n=1 Tax=unclassified Streptomyces TaxID=2593676 RepID=UPI00344D3657
MRIVVERGYESGPIDYERLVSLVESTGERVVLAERGVPVSVLLPAGKVAEWEHWARAEPPAPEPVPQADDEDEGEDEDDDGPGREVGRLRVEALAEPLEYGPYVRCVRGDGRRVSFVRGGMVVAVQLGAGDAVWLRDRVRQARQGYMSPRQAAAFEEFLARQQPPVGGS